jgi:hypothetical protein
LAYASRRRRHLGGGCLAQLTFHQRELVSRLQIEPAACAGAECSASKARGSVHRGVTVALCASRHAQNAFSTSLKKRGGK